MSTRLVIAVPKEYNVRRHYETMHREKCDGYAGKIREDQVMKLNQHYANKEVSLPML